MGLTKSQKRKYWVKIMSRVSSYQMEIHVNKHKFRTALDVVMDYFDGNYNNSMWNGVVSEVAEEGIDGGETTVKKIDVTLRDDAIQQWFSANKGNLRTEMANLIQFSDQDDLDRKVPKVVQKRIIRDLLYEKLDKLT